MKYTKTSERNFSFYDIVT